MYNERAHPDFYLNAYGVRVALCAAANSFPHIYVTRKKIPTYVLLICIVCDLTAPDVYV